MEDILTYRDWLGGGLGLLFSYFLFHLTMVAGEDNLSCRRTLQFGFVFKILCALLYALVYQYYYGRGDVFHYFRSSRELNSLLWSDMGGYLDFLLHSPYHLPYELEWMRSEWYILTPSTKWVDVLGSLVLIPGYSSYLWLSFLFAFFSFWGSFQLYKLLFQDRTGNSRWLPLLGFMCVPSFVFWSSGFSKESCLLFLLGLVAFLLRSRKGLLGLVLIPLCLWLVFQIKSYVLVTLLLAWYVHCLLSLVSGRARLKDIFVLAVTVVLMMWPSTRMVAIRAGQNAIQDLVTIQVVQLRETERDGGVGYTLNRDWMQDFPSFLEASFMSLGVTLFRPFPWECRKPIHYLQLIENLALLGLFVMLLVIGYRPASWGRLYDVLLIWTLIFAIVVGLTSYNFGTLSRYRILLLPIIVSLISLWLPSSFQLDKPSQSEKGAE